MRMPTRAFEKLNLRKNPFGELTPDEQAATALVNLKPILDVLASGASVQLLGRCGRGKSTHLRCLNAALPNAHYARVWSREFTGVWPPRAPSLPSDISLLLLDEADHLLWWSRIALFRRPRQLVVATHSDISTTLRLAGHRSQIVEVAQHPTLLWLREALNRRIRYFRRTDAPVPELTDEELQQLRADFGDNLRGMERHLYNDFQRRNS